MAKTVNEKISMLMDEELNEHEWRHVFEDMKSNDETKSCWETFHLISETLRNNLPHSLHPQLTNQISKALEQEPPHQIPQQTSQPISNITPFSFKAITSYALAASVTVVAIVGILLYNQKPQIQIDTQQIAATPILNQAVRVDDKTMIIVPVKSGSINSQFVQWQGPSQDIDPDIYDYLVSHNEYAVTAPAQGGMLPYARLVGYAAEE